MRPQPAASMSGTAACTQVKVPVRLTARIRSHFSAVMSSSGVERLDAGAGDEDLDRTELGADPRERGVDRRAVGDVDLDADGRRTVARARRPRRRPRRCRSSIATRWPSAANWRATPSPMPDAPPVTTATRLIGARLDRRELEVQLGEAAQHPGRLVAEAAVAGRAVVLLGEPDVAHPVEDALEADPALGPRQRRARAGVVAAPERDVGLRVGAVDPELGRALEPPGVAVGRAVQQHHRRARPRCRRRRPSWRGGRAGSRPSPGSRCAAPLRGSPG